MEQVKGTTLKTTYEYIKETFTDRLNEWIEAMPDISKKFYTDPIFVGNWYPLKEGLLIPTELAGKLFFDGDIQKAGYELGKYSAVVALKGVYKIFVKIASIDFVIKRASTIFSTYYSSAKLDIFESTPSKFYKIHIIGFHKDEVLIMDRIIGWIDGMFSVITKKLVEISYVVDDLGNNEILGTITAQLVSKYQL